jgi:hypothetical protein
VVLRPTRRLRLRRRWVRLWRCLPDRGAGCCRCRPGQRPTAMRADGQRGQRGLRLSPGIEPHCALFVRQGHTYVSNGGALGQSNLKNRKGLSGLRLRPAVAGGCNAHKLARVRWLGQAASAPRAAGMALPWPPVAFLAEFASPLETLL